MRNILLSKKMPLLGILILFLSLSVSAQNRTITGKINSNNGTPVEGASVTVKGSQTGVTSKADGTYSIQVPAGTVVLIFSYVGFVTQEVPIGNRTEVSVNLEESS